MQSYLFSKFNLTYNFFLVLDDIGHGVRSGGTPRQKQRGSSQGSIQSIASAAANNVMVGPAPTTKPPTPPQVSRTGSKGIY